MQEKVSEFEITFGMIQAFGCIDRAHIPIKRPRTDSQNYFNFKQLFSLNVQTICDSQGSFMDVECKWPGSVHDAKVFSNSYVCQSLQNGNLAKTHFSLRPGFEAKPNYLIGDPAYPLNPFCMKEFQYCAENKHVLFSHMLRSARNQIESAFGRLKARWRILTKPIDLELDTIPLIIYTCFVLHNYCQTKSSSALDEDEVEAHMEWHKLEEANMAEQPDPVYSSKWRGIYKENNHRITYITIWIHLKILLEHMINLQTYFYRTENSGGHH